jgi:hypothetical protein
LLPARQGRIPLPSRSSSGHRLPGHDHALTESAVNGSHLNEERSHHDGMPFPILEEKHVGRVGVGEESTKLGQS